MRILLRLQHRYYFNYYFNTENTQKNKKIFKESQYKQQVTQSVVLLVGIPSKDYFKTKQICTLQQTHRGPYQFNNMLN